MLLVREESLPLHNEESLLLRNEESLLLRNDSLLLRDVLLMHDLILRGGRRRR